MEKKEKKDGSGQTDVYINGTEGKVDREAAKVRNDWTILLIV